jgi:multiple sugar transport system permease protein
MQQSNYYRNDAALRKAIRVAETIVFYLVVLFFLAVFMFVFAWMVSTSLKIPRDASTYPPIWIFRPTLQNYMEVLRQNPMGLYFRNSLIVAVGSVTFSLLVAVPAAYSIARFRQSKIALMVLIVRMLPSVVFGLPYFVLFKNLGLIDTHLGLIITHLTLVVPTAIWILIGFFEDVPPDLEEAARIDGASRVGAFFRIAMPLCMPGMAVAAILGFIASWNNFLFVLMLGGRKTITAPMAVYNFLVFEDIQLGPLTAAAALITLPILVIALFAQRYLVAGLSMGAVKG